MEKIYLLILTISFSIIVGVIGFWLRTALKEFKTLIKELMASVHKLNNAISEIRTQIEKGLEADISEIKEDVKVLYRKANNNESALSILKQKSA